MTRVSQRTRKEKWNLRMGARLFGTAGRPRVSVFRSSRAIYVQVIDDEKRETILAVSTREIDEGTKTEKAFRAGQNLAKKLTEVGIRSVVFDREGSKYHGRVKAFADGAREGGLQF